MYIFETTGNLPVTTFVLEPADAEWRGLSNWSLKPLQQQSDAEDNEILVERLSHVLFEMGARDVFAPHVAAASGRVVNTSRLINRIRLGKASLYRNENIPADGVFLEMHQAFMMSSAGCPIIVAKAGNHLVVAHAGRDSLIDRSAVMGEPTREYVSIVDAIMAEFRDRGMSADDVTMTMILSISAKDFEHDANHPVYGDYNRALAEFVDASWPNAILRRNGKTFLDLEQVFLGQARQAGVENVSVMDSLSDFPRLTHTRNGTDVDRRNLVVVMRDS